MAQTYMSISGVSRRTWWIGILAGLLGALPAAAYDAAALAQKLANLTSEYERASKAAAGVSVLALDSGKVLAASRPDELFMPASNQKLLTSAVALARLGGDFKFRTAVYALGKDLVVVGDGDPTLGDPLLARENAKSIYEPIDAWVAQVRQTRGAHIEGDILLTSCFRLDRYRHADWPHNQYHCWYAAPVAGLNFNNNCFDVTIARTPKGLAPCVSPESRYIRVVNQLTAGKKSTWSLIASTDDSVVRITGTAAAASTEPYSVAANNPPLMVGRVLAERLLRAGVAFAGNIREVDARGLDLRQATLVASTTTPLSVAMARANKRSLNMMAECMFLRAGSGEWAGSARLAAETLRAEYGLGEKDVVISDGSGLSRNNLVSPSAMTRLLTGVLKRRDAAVFLKSMAVSGIDGTIDDRLDDRLCKGRVLAKTGYIAGVSTLSGYVLDKSGRPTVAFSILLNKVGDLSRAKQFQDTLVRAIVEAISE